MTLRLIAGTLLVTAAMAAPAHAQAQAKPAADVIDVLIDFLLKQQLKQIAPTAPTAKQVVAPAGANGTTTVASGPSFPELVGLAFDNDMAGLKDGVFTVDLNAFAFRALANPAVDADQTMYARPGNGLLRRIAVAFSVGGKGEKFDRDGDGKSDVPLTANALTDIVTGELRLRIAGSRDRRDDENFKRFKTQAGAEHAALAAATQAFLVAHVNELPMTKPNANGDRSIDAEKFEAFLERPELLSEVQSLAAVYARFVRAQESAVKAIDRRAVWTLVAGGTRHAEAFGPDRAHAGLHGVKTAGAWDNTLNVDWKRAEAFTDRPAATSWTAAFEASRLLFKDTLSDAGVKLSLGAHLEWHKNVPATHRKIARAALGFAIPMSPKVSVPITLTYANHADLLDAAHVWAGQVGLAWDLSGSGNRK